MTAFAKIYFFLFAAFTAAGGVTGFVKAQSTPSLIAGVVSGILLAVSGYLMPSKPGAGSLVGLVVSLMLLGRFLPAYLKKEFVMPDLPMAIISALPMAILSAIGILTALVVLVRR